MENDQIRERTPIDGVESLEAALVRVREAQKKFATYTQEQVDAIFKAAAIAANQARIPLAKMAVEETGMGIVEDKVIKNNYAAEYIYNAYKNTKTCGVIEEDKAYGIKKIAEPIDNLSRFADSLGMGRYRHTRAADLGASVCAHFQGRLPDEQIATACAIAEKIRKSRGIDIDTLCSELDLSYAAVSTLAAALESDGFIIMDLMQRCSINTGNY